MKLLKNNGFSLVEIVIATGVLGVMAVIGLNLSKIQTASTTKNSFNAEINLITNEIVAILSDPSKCTATFGGKNALSTTTGINSINGNKYFSLPSGSAPANGYGNANVNIASYTLEATAANIAAKNSFLLIHFQNKNFLKGSAGPENVIKKLNLYVNVDGSDNITSCRSLSASSADIWSRGTGSVIYYNGGNIGIGTTTPEHSLDVFGTVGTGNRIESSVDGAGNAFWLARGTSVEGNRAGFRLNADPSTGVVNSVSLRTNGTDRIHSDINGNIGIGTNNPQARLDVLGGIRPGDQIQVPTCDSTTEGTQRYNRATHTMEFCNGTIWKAPSATISSTCYWGADAKAYTCNPGYVVTGFNCTGDCGSGSMKVQCCLLE